MTALIALLLACGPKAPTETAAAATSALSPTPPTPGAPRDFTPPLPTVHTLDSGATVWLISDDSLPLVSLRVIVAGGEAADGNTPGLTSFADTMLTHGAGDLDAPAFAAAVDQRAIDLGISTKDTNSTAWIDCQADQLVPALDLLADALLRPRFDADEVDRVRDVRLGELTVALDSPRSVASQVADRVYYGDGHPLAGPRSGTPDSIGAMTAKQLRASWELRRDATTPTFVVVGAVDADTLLPALQERFGGWSGGATDIAVPAPTGTADGPRMVFVDAPGSAQTVLQVRLPAPDLSADVATLSGARLTTTVLGGTFTSRLNRKLREEEGYTYGAWAGFYPQDGFGEVIASTQVQRDVTAPALRDLLAELRRIQEGVTADELTKARGSRRTDLIDGSGSRDGLADMYTGLAVHGQPTDSFATRLAAEAAVDPAAALATYGDTVVDHAAVIVVGDLAVIRGPVEEMVPGTWELLDVWGAPVE